MSKTFDQLSIRLWPMRALTVDQEDRLLQRWEALLESREVVCCEGQLQGPLRKDLEEVFTVGELVDLVSVAPGLPDVLMLDVYACDAPTGEAMAFRVHLDHQPVRQLLKLYRRRVLDSEQVLMCLRRFNQVDEMPQALHEVA